MSLTLRKGATTMTLEEAIAHTEEKGQGIGHCAGEHRQLAMWLKDYRECLYLLKQFANDEGAKMHFRAKAKVMLSHHVNKE